MSEHHPGCELSTGAKRCSCAARDARILGAFVRDYLPYDGTPEHGPQPSAEAPERLSEEAVRERLREAVKAAGGQRAFARAHNFSAAYVNDVVLGRRVPAENICTALGVTRRVVYTVEYKVRAAKKRAK